MANLITKADLVSVCGLNSLVEDRKIDPWIREAHLRWMKILGPKLYDLQQANPTESRFVDLMEDGKGWGKSYLCWKALELAYPSLAAEADRGGVFQKEEQGRFQSVSTGTLAMLRSTAESAAEARETLLFAWLRANADIYPELHEAGAIPRVDDSNRRNVAGLSFRRSRHQDTYRG